MIQRLVGRRIAVALLCLAGFIGLRVWSAIPASIPARGSFHDFQIDTTVDSESAKYYIESSTEGRVDDHRIHDAILTLKRAFGQDVPDHRELRLIARAYSVDFAALFFADQLLSLDRNARVNRQFRENLDHVLQGGTIADAKDIVVVLVPGYDYRENGHATGADLAAQVELLHRIEFQVVVVEVDPIGTVLESAAVVETTIQRLRDQDILIAGPSSAGPAIHAALSRLGEGSGVVAWLNLGGTLRGVPVLDWFEGLPQRLAFDSVVWFNGWRRESFESLTTRMQRDQFEAQSIPADVQVFNYISLSLSGDISNFGWDTYLLMRSDGPNDGLSLLPDLVLPAGRTILSPKGDHFFAEDPLIRQKSAALLLTILESLD